MESAVSDMWNQVHEGLRAFIAKRIQNEAEIDDLLQDVFLRVHRHIENLQQPDRMVSWVYQITRNAIVDHYRTTAQRREVPAGTATDINGNQPVMFNEAEEHEATYELSECLRPMISRLSPAYREAIILVELDGLTHRDAAKRLNLSVPGMKSRVLRGRRQLRQMLDQCCLIELDSRRGVAHYERRLPDCACEPPHTGVVSSLRTNGYDEMPVEWSKDGKSGK